MISTSIRSEAFVGRAEELMFLRARAREAIDGGSSTVIVSGEIGIGKTRLLDEFFRRHAAELRVVRIRCSSTVRETETVLQELCEGFASLLLQDPPQGAGAGRALAHLRAAIRSARGGTPIVIAVEDAHHATGGAIDALEQLAGSARTMLLLTLAPEGASVEVHDALDRLRRRDAYELTLAPLPAEAMRRMIRRFQTEPAVLSRSFVSRVVEFAHGNPSLAQELIRAATQDGGDAEVPVPRSLRARVRRTLSGFDPHVRHMLLIAAALGSEFEIKALAHVAQERAALVREAMQAAAMADLVRETATGHFAFADPLYRLALQADTTAAFASGYHRRAAA
jgi:predicted ATPase